MTATTKPSILILFGTKSGNSELVADELAELGAQKIAARVDCDEHFWPETWHKMVQTNLDGVFYLTREIVPFMKRKKTTSHIINIGSILGKTVNAKQSAYSATKYAIQGFSEALFKERYDGIKVTCLNPGSIKTDFFRKSGIHSHSNMLSPNAVAQTVVHVLETPDNVLISDITLRPLNPKKSG